MPGIPALDLYGICGAVQATSDFDVVSSPSPLSRTLSLVLVSAHATAARLIAVGVFHCDVAAKPRTDP